MIAIRSFLPSLLTFPGVILRQLTHFAVCRALGIKVLDIRIFRADTPSGYVLHEMPSRFSTGILVAVLPLLIHSALCVLLCTPAWIPIRYFDSAASCFTFFQIWVGLSLGIHAFPPFRDSSRLWELSIREVMNHGVAIRLLIPFVLLFRVAHRLSLFGFDLLYAGMIGVALPHWILGRWVPPI